MGADLGYIGSAFIASEEANAQEAYKKMIVDCGADDIVYTDKFTGVHGNYLKPSLKAAGINPDDLLHEEKQVMDFAKASGDEAKAWKHIWGSGQGIGTVEKIEPVAAIVERLKREYAEARRRLFEES